MEGLGEGSSKALETVLETLKTRGWCLGDIDQINALFVIQSALSDDGDPYSVANSIDSELLSMDLRSIGAKSLPDPLNKTSYLHGPKILQISSVRDISVSSLEGFSNSSNRRLLKFTLTDGHNEITAIEYSHIPSIPNDVVPGSKVRLENKAPVHSSILCLNPKVITLLGGTVQSLYEEWQMTKKYSAFSRSSARPSHETDSCGPPPFEKLQILPPSHQRGRPSDRFESTSKGTRQIAMETNANTKRKEDNIDKKLRIACLTAREEENRRNSQWRLKEDYHESTSKSNLPTVAETSGDTEVRPMDEQQIADHDKLERVALYENIKQKPSNSTARQKEVVESVPVQNQAAAQKLLLKMNHPNQADRFSRGQRHRGKGKQEESEVFTLEEWEKRKAQTQAVTKNELLDASCDEDLAWKLQNQLDMEDSHVRGRIHSTVVDDIRKNMFNYERNGNTVHEIACGSRGRGNRRGSWRGRGRGRGSSS